MLALSVCAGCYESHAAAPHGVDAGDDVPPSACPFPDEAVMVVDDTPGCRFASVDASDGADVCPLEVEHLVDIRHRASVRVIHRGRREYVVATRARVPGGFAWLIGDPRDRSRGRARECECEHFASGVALAPSRIWHSSVREPGTETHALLGTRSPGARVEVAVCVDADVYDEDVDSPALGP